MTAAHSHDGPIDLSALDRKDYESLFHRHYQWLCLQAAKITNDWHAAEDIVQDFFARCWQNRATIQIKESFAAFALVSVRNSAINYLKKESTRQRHESASTDTAETLSLPSPADEKDLLYLRVIQAINNLPTQRRKAFILSRRQDMTYAGIAEELGISVNTVKMHLRLAWQELRATLTAWAPFLLFFTIF